MKRISVSARFFAGFAVLLATPVLHAQASPTASHAGDLSIGVGFVTADSDYLSNRFRGVGAWADYDFLPHIGATAEFHYVSDPNGSGQYEATYEVGARYHRTYAHGRLMPYAKILYGRGVYNFTQPYQLEAGPVTPGNPIRYFDEGTFAYNLIAVGAGADYKVKPWLYVRGDWEYQHWFNFLGDSLTPNLITIGAAYHFR